MRRTLLLAAAACCLSGCTLFPEALQPHQLWKLNRQPASGRDDGLFSVSDPFLDEAPAEDAETAGEPEGIVYTAETPDAASDWQTDPF